MACESLNSNGGYSSRPTLKSLALQVAIIVVLIAIAFAASTQSDQRSRYNQQPSPQTGTASENLSARSVASSQARANSGHWSGMPLQQPQARTNVRSGSLNVRSMVPTPSRVRSYAPGQTRPPLVKSNGASAMSFSLAQAGDIPQEGAPTQPPALETDEDFDEQFFEGDGNEDDDDDDDDVVTSPSTGGQTRDPLALAQDLFNNMKNGQLPGYSSAPNSISINNQMSHIKVGNKKKVTTNNMKHIISPKIEGSQVGSFSLSGSPNINLPGSGTQMSSAPGTFNDDIGANGAPNIKEKEKATPEQKELKKKLLELADKATSEPELYKQKLHDAISALSSRKLPVDRLKEILDDIEDGKLDGQIDMGSGAGDDTLLEDDLPQKDDMPPEDEEPMEGDAPQENDAPPAPDGEDLVQLVRNELDDRLNRISDLLHFRPEFLNILLRTDDANLTPLEAEFKRLVLCHSDEQFCDADLSQFLNEPLTDEDALLQGGDEGDDTASFEPSALLSSLPSGPGALSRSKSRSYYYYNHEAESNMVPAASAAASASLPVVASNGPTRGGSASPIVQRSRGGAMNVRSTGGNSSPAFRSNGSGAIGRAPQIPAQQQGNQNSFRVNNAKTVRRENQQQLDRITPLFARVQTTQQPRSQASPTRANVRQPTNISQKQSQANQSKFARVVRQPNELMRSN